MVETHWKALSKTRERKHTRNIYLALAVPPKREQLREFGQVKWLFKSINQKLGMQLPGGRRARAGCLVGGASAALGLVVCVALILHFQRSLRDVDLGLNGREGAATAKHRQLSVAQILKRMDADGREAERQATEVSLASHVVHLGIRCGIFAVSPNLFPRSR